MLRSLPSIFVVLLVLSGCRVQSPGFFLLDSEDPSLVQDLGMLLGTWDWLYDTRLNPSDDGFVRVGPDQTGTTERLTFEANGTLRSVQNGTLAFEGTFDIEEICNDELGVCRLFLTGTLDPLFFGANEDRLVLSWISAGGVERVFVRLPEEARPR